MTRVMPFIARRKAGAADGEAGLTECAILRAPNRGLGAISHQQAGR